MHDYNTIIGVIGLRNEKYRIRLYADAMALVTVA